MKTATLHRSDFVNRMQPTKKLTHFISPYTKQSFSKSH